MKRKIISLTILVVALFPLISCNKIDKDKLKVIENLSLGVNEDEFERECITKNIKKKAYVANKAFFNEEDIPDNVFKCYASDVFNLENYKPKWSDHMGLIVPVMSYGTDNIVSMRVMLGYTSLGKYEGKLLDGLYDPKGFSQNVRYDLVREIKNILINKYGEPTEVIKSNKLKCYVFEGQSLTRYTTGEFEGQILKWETKYIKISFFGGVKDYAIIYDHSLDAYLHTLREPNEEVKGETYSMQYPYLQYEIKDKYIEQMKLNKPKI